MYFCYLLLRKFYGIPRFVYSGSSEDPQPETGVPGEGRVVIDPQSGPDTHALNIRYKSSPSSQWSVNRGNQSYFSTAHYRQPSYTTRAFPAYFRTSTPPVSGSSVGFHQSTRGVGGFV